MCCGRERTQLRTPAKPSVARPANVAQPQRPQSPASFVYTGNTALTVTGPASGIQYRFAHPGARVDADPRDRILLASLRQLRQVK